MPRIRSVSPDICISETMATLSAELERTFVRLWTHCDDEGRCVDNPRLIKAAIYPLHDEITHIALDKELTELAKAGLLIRYSAGALLLIQVRSWGEYQHPQRPTPSKYPPPPEPSASTHGDIREPSATRLGLELGVGEGEGEGVGVVAAVADAPGGATRRRPRDPLWDTLVQALGLDAHELTNGARGSINAALGDLRRANATPDDIHTRVQWWRDHWQDRTLTAAALAKHWATIGAELNRGPTQKAPKSWTAIAASAERDRQRTQADQRGLP